MCFHFATPHGRRHNFMLTNPKETKPRQFSSSARKHDNKCRQECLNQNRNCGDVTNKHRTT
jgi:hypothetical protein